MKCSEISKRIGCLRFTRSALMELEYEEVCNLLHDLIVFDANSDLANDMACFYGVSSQFEEIEESEREKPIEELPVYIALNEDGKVKYERI